MLAVLHQSHSAGGFLLTGCGLAFLLDRYVFRLLPWRPVRWRREVCLRGGTFLVAAVIFYFLRPGVVLLTESVYRGAMVCLTGALLERIPILIGGTGRRRWAGTALASALLVLLSPIIVFLHPLHTVPKRGPNASGLAFDDVRFRSADGRQLAAWVVPHPHARGNIIFCHGHGRSRGQVAGMLRQFHALALNVMAFDFRGHGDSDGHTSTFGHREVNDLLAAVQYMRHRYPDQPLLLAGVSLGAAVALQALPQLPDVRGVWSEGAFARLDHTVDHEFQWLPRLVRRPLENVYYALGWLDCGFWGPSVNPVDRLEGVSVPVFFCHGREDDLVPLTEGQLLFERYRGPKECWWVEHASHYNVRQRNHQEYLRRLANFLESCLSRNGDCEK